jgi:hypothetical protein
MMQSDTTEASVPVKPAPIYRGFNLVRTAEPLEAEVIRTEAHAGWSKGWLARMELIPPVLEGTYAKDVSLTFFSADEENLSRAGNGSKTYAGPFDGVFVAESVWRSMTAHRHYMRFIDGVLVADSSDEDDARAWLGATETKDELTARLRAEREKHIAAQTQATAAVTPLPELTGSEKQVKWANDLRVQAIEKLRGIHPALVVLAGCPAEAKWWIDNRGPNTLLSLIGLVWRRDPQRFVDVLGIVAADATLEEGDIRFATAPSTSLDAAEVGDAVVEAVWERVADALAKRLQKGGVYSLFDRLPESLMERVAAHAFARLLAADLNLRPEDREALAAAAKRYPIA